MPLPRTIDKMRALMPGGNPNGYFINGTIKGISGFLLERLGVSEDELREVIQRVDDEDEVAAWLRTRVDVSIYPILNATLQRIEPRHSQDPEAVRAEYFEVLRDQPQLRTIFDILAADDHRRYSTE